jgi:hypothetical protein
MMNGSQSQIGDQEEADLSEEELGITTPRR